MVERLGEMRKGRREMIEIGSHCFFKSSGYQASKFSFYKLIECIIKKKMSWCETEMQKYVPLVNRM